MVATETNPRNVCLMQLPYTYSQHASHVSRSVLIHAPCAQIDLPRYISCTVTEDGAVDCRTITSNGVDIGPHALASLFRQPVRAVASSIDARVDKLVECTKRYSTELVEPHAVAEAQYHHFLGGGDVYFEYRGARQHDALKSATSWVNWNPATQTGKLQQGEVTCAVDVAHLARWSDGGGDGSWVPLRATKMGKSNCNRLLEALCITDRMQNWDAKQSSPEWRGKLEAHSADIHALMAEALLGAPFAGMSAHVERCGPVNGVSQDGRVFNKAGALIPVTGRACTDTCLSDTVMMHSRSGTIYIMTSTTLEEFMSFPKCVGEGVRVSLRVATDASVPPLLVREQLVVHGPSLVSPFLDASYACTHNATSTRNAGRSDTCNRTPFPGTKLTTLAAYRLAYDADVDGVDPVGMSSICVTDPGVCAVGPHHELLLMRAQPKLQATRTTLLNSVTGELQRAATVNTPVGIHMSGVCRATHVLGRALPKLLQEAKKHIQDITPVRLLKPDTVAALPHRLASKLTLASVVADELNRVHSMNAAADIAKVQVLPVLHQELLGPVTAVYKVSDRVVGELDRSVIAVQHRANDNEDITLLFPGHTGTDPEAFASNVYIDSPTLRENSSMRRVLRIPEESVVQWKGVTPVHVYGSGECRAPPNGTSVRADNWALFNVDWAVDGVTHTALCRVPAANRHNPLEGPNGMARLFTRTLNGKITTYLDGMWGIHVIRAT